MSQWLETTKATSIWISLDEDHNDQRTFLEYLAAGLGKKLNHKLDGLDNLIDSTKFPPPKAIAQILLKLFETLEHEIILVLDDYYFITNPEIHEMVRQVLRYLPAHIHIAILTRRDPSLGLPAMRAGNNLNELGIDDLSFTESDIHQLNKILLNIELSNETIRNLWEKTEGWIVGLRMASLMVPDPKDAEEVYQNISGSMHLISDFLLSEVLSKHPAAFREMLLRTSVLNRFCTDLIEETFIKDQTGNDISFDAGEFMQWLIKSKIFSIQLDTEQKWVRYHHLFQELLNKELRRSFTKEDIQGSCNRASLWFDRER